MSFEYEIVRLWQRPAERLLAGELGLAPLAVLGQLPTGTAVDDALSAVVRRLVDRVAREAQPEQATKLVTTALLLSGLRVDRNVALKIFRGIPMLEESDTYLMILERGELRATRRSILLFGEARFGAADEAVKNRLAAIEDGELLTRMVQKAATASSWEEIFTTS